MHMYFLKMYIYIKILYIAGLVLEPLKRYKPRDTSHTICITNAALDTTMAGTYIYTI